MAETENGARLRIDRWLWFARFFKSRSAATRLCVARRVRLNGQVVSKPSQVISAGDVLTFPQARQIRTVRIVDLGDRRGPAAEAALLYEDLAPPTATAPGQRGRGPLERPPAARDKGSGRPTKAERRALQKLLGTD